MEHKVFSVRDDAVEAYMQPFYLPTKGAAIRAISDLLRDPNHNFSKHTSDFTLFELGVYDDATGMFDLFQAPLSLGNLLEFKVKD